MSKFEDILTLTGDSLIQKRAATLAAETKETFEDEKRNIEKQIRQKENDIITMEDLSVRSTQSLVVGESLNSKEWVNKRINLALELRDLQVELEVIKELIAEYFV